MHCKSDVRIYSERSSISLAATSCPTFLRYRIRNLLCRRLCQAFRRAVVVSQAVAQVVEGHSDAGAAQLYWRLADAAAATVSLKYQRSSEQTHDPEGPQPGSGTGPGKDLIPQAARLQSISPVQIGIAAQ